MPVTVPNWNPTWPPTDNLRQKLLGFFGFEERAGWEFREEMVSCAEADEMVRAIRTVRIRCRGKVRFI